MKTTFTILILIFLTSACQSPATDISMNKIDDILAEQIERHKTPSVQYYFFNQDTILKTIQKGYANISEQTKADTNTTYNAFSVTKTFTALAVLQLTEKGKIDINNPVIQYLPEFLYGAEITVKHLLTHTSGLPNPIPLSWIHLEREHKDFERNAFFQAIFDKHGKVKSKPNEKFAYSNLGYVILGQLIEKVSGKTYEEYITDNIIRKLPIKSDDLAFEIINNKIHAKGYHKKMSFSNFLLSFFIDKSKFMGKTEGKWRSFNKFYVNGASYGGLIGTPTAFVSYLQELLKAESSLISEEYKQMLFQENKTNKGKNTGMCFSWFTGKLGGNKYYAHAGGGGGYYCEIRIYPDIQKGSVVFFNRTGMSDERFLDNLDKYFMNE
jgi:D-alanyl-D-alanine carboxypeptidase